MLTRLNIRNIVLIENLDLEFRAGLTVLTGETGAGKSILLDALGLALGARAAFDLIGRYGDDAQVSACFDLPHEHGNDTVLTALADAGIDTGDGAIVLRRRLLHGKSAAFINDIPVSGGLLRRIGNALVEVQGQFEGRGLLDVATHRSLLDRYAGAEELAGEVAAAWHALIAARVALQEARDEIEAARAEEGWLRDAVATLDELAPEAGEEERLAGERAIHGNAGKIAEALELTETAVAGHDDSGGAGSMGQAMRALDRVAESGGSIIAPVSEALTRMEAEREEAIAAIHAARARLDADPERLAMIDDRLHALRAQARKHKTDPDGLPAIHAELMRRLSGLDDRSGTLASKQAAEEQARGVYENLRDALRDKRMDAAAKLDAEVRRELPELKLEAAQFTTVVEALPEEKHGMHGGEQIRFEATTNPGMPPGPIDRIASGGELARFLLALKVVLAATSAPATLIFDEVDSGVGGAVAAAVGRRLARLGETMQCLVITHSPQVASRGNRHYRIAKSGGTAGMTSTAEALHADGRLEEIGRMLAGARITPEARAAAHRLLEQD